MRNDRFLRALRREPTDRTPVWIMRQAGRYLPEYRATRQRAGSFLGLLRNPELALEVTLQPLARYPLDAAILFSDILTIPDALGLGLHFVEGEGPRFARRIASAADVRALPRVAIATELGYVYEAVRRIKHELADRVPLIGFSGSPFTLACYMVEGGSSERFERLKALLWNEPQVLHELLDRLTDSVIEYLVEQARAGADALMVFDSWGGTLSALDYPEFSLRGLHRISAALRTHPDTRDRPLIVFSKGANTQLEALSRIGCAALGLDWTVALGEARRRTGDRVALQGNLDPCVLYARPEAIRAQVELCLRDYGSGPGHVFNLGHGIPPDVDPERLAVLIEAVQQASLAQRGEARLA